MPLSHSSLAPSWFGSKALDGHSLNIVAASIHKCCEAKVRKARAIHAKRLHKDHLCISSCLYMMYTVNHSLSDVIRSMTMALFLLAVLG